MEQNKILVVLPVINLWSRYTLHCVESIYSSKCNVPVDVLIVDNNSTDETVENARDFGNRKMPNHFHVKHNDTNKGCAGGWNDGVDFALKNGFTHILIANNDILFAPNTIQIMYDRIIKGDKYLVSAVDISRELKIPQDILDENNPINKKETSEAPHPNFSCYMITAKTIEDVGMFDEGFYPAYFEDNDYHYRLKLAGGDDTAIAHLPAVFYHYGSRTQNESSNMPVVPSKMFEDNRNYFTRKWGGIPTRETFKNPFNDLTKNIKNVTRRN
jgi:GT2 family glycosyltransferase